MKISSLQENFKNGLLMVGHTAGKNVNLPILNNVLVEAKDGKIKLVATNLELAVSSVVRGKIEKDGSYTVDSKIIADYIGLLPNSKVDIEETGGRLSIQCDNYKTKMNGQSAEDYPLIPEVKRDNFYKIGKEEFKKALSQVIFAAANSETRVELSGVLFSFSGSDLVLAATDSYRLAEKKIKLEKENGADGEKKFIVPVKTLHEVIRILSSAKDEAESIELHFSENQVLFVYGDTEIISRLIEGNYPDYRQIIPTAAKTTALIESSELARGVKASALFSKTGVNDINLDLPKGQSRLIISSASGQTGENITEIQAEVKGEDNGVVLNYRYLLDGLNNLDEATVKIEIVDSNTPCILRSQKGKDYLYIIMPIKQ